MDLELSVSTEDRVIVVNGEGRRFGDDFPATDANLRALMWAPKRQGRCNGAALYHTGGSEAFDEWERVKPYYEAWVEKSGEPMDNVVRLPPHDLPRFLRPSEEPSVAPEMQATLADFERRVAEVQARPIPHIPDDLASRIAALEGFQVEIIRRFDALKENFAVALEKLGGKT